MTSPAAPVQEMTRSAAAIAAGRPARSAVLPPTDAARRSACRRVRFATTTWAAPALAAVVAASELIDPAPTTSTLRPLSDGLPTASAAASIPTLTRLAPVWSIPVSECARLPVRRAAEPTSPSTRPRVPFCRATLSAVRTCPRIWPSPTTMESSPAATARRCLTAPSS